MNYKLHNRRYIGNKYKLLNFIDSVLTKEKIQFKNFADLFAGTGVVSQYFLSKDKNVIINDTLFSNYIFYNAWLSNLKYSKTKIKKYIDYYNNSTDYIKDNYFSDTFSNTYYHHDVAKKIGSIRINIEENKKKFTKREYYILLSSLLYTADKIANTVGHFEAFLSKRPNNQKVLLNELDIKTYQKNPTILQEDANKLVKNIKSDIIYIDPPYNARQYINFYHLLENLAEWQCPKVYGKTLKMERDLKKSDYSKSSAPLIFEDLINNCNCKYILVSYNNTYKANSTASINKISSTQIESVLSKVGTVKKFDIGYKYFNTGKTNFDNHKEILYLCFKTKY